MLDARPVKGRYRRLRWWMNAVLMAVLFAPPWIEIAGEPLLRLDIPARKFHVFGLVIFPQELLFLWLIVIGLALMLFFFTALAGRLWCGWACPQTVFTDVFAALARRIQGWGSRTRPPAHVARWRVVATHAVWLAICAVTGFHLVAYFQSPYEMLAGLGRETSRTTAGFLAFATLLAYLDFGLARQAFCKYLCPYARFQGVLFDGHTLVIGYDRRRGEPRGKRGRAAGDCVDCGLCVAVCPTGIDIRDGLQLECVACTQCIDACDGVMARLRRAPGLIAYRSLVSLEGRGRVRWLRPRVLAYGALLAAVVGGFTVGLARRVPLDLQVARNREALYQMMPDGRVGNAYTLHIQNRDRQDHDYRIVLDAPAGFALITGANPVSVPATSTRETRVFVVADPAGRSAANGPLEITFRIAGERVWQRSTFVLPAAKPGAPDAA